METIEPVKSSNEILTELFGAFNAEPPKLDMKLKIRSSSEDGESKHKKSKKSKKSKKKHKSKSKKHKRKRSESSSESGSETEKKKSKKKKKKKRSSSSSVDIELPVDKVPMALEIMLDGTVGIKGEDGKIKKITETNRNDKENKALSDWENEGEMKHNGDLSLSTNEERKDNEKTDDNSMLPEVFEEPDSTVQGEKVKKGKIQIRDLKFSSVYQETVKAVEEKQKREEEKKANYEEGELSDSSGSEKYFESDSKHKSRQERKSRKSSNHHREDLRLYLKKKRRSRSRSRHDDRPYSSERVRYRRSRSRELYHDTYYPRERERERYRHSSIEFRSHYSRSTIRDTSRHERSRSRKSRSRSRERKEKPKTSHRSEPRELKHRSETKSTERDTNVEKIDKEKLLAIARKNALKLIDAGIVPGAEKLTTIKAGGKTVNELTEYCKKLSKKEALGDDVSDIESESSDEGEKPFHHPFQVRDRPNSIIMNIKNSIPLPTKSLQEKAAEQSKQLRLQFPVSSGSSHRQSEWIPVSPPKKEIPPEKPKAAPPLPVEKPPVPLALPAPAPIPIPTPVQIHPPVELSAVPPPEPVHKPVFPVIQPGPSAPKLDISAIVSKRLEAMRKLQENPNDSQALMEMYKAQKEMQSWAETKHETGAFTGSTGAKILSASELSGGAQAWAKRDQLTSATPVKGGMGMALLQKMGWQPGEGLGKNKEGTLEPLKLEVKMDKKGLLAADELKKGKGKGVGVQQGPLLPTVKTLDGKHPVSLLNEYCSRRKYGVPQFELCFECGPDHKKNFLFKVKVNGVEYTPSVASPNKKQAKAEAAAICLRALGVISSNS